MPTLKKLIVAIFAAIGYLSVNGQTNNYYFPPNNSEEWEMIDLQTLNWNINYIDSLYDFLDSNNTKGFIILQDGKIALEKYFDTFTKDSIWYWASAGKSVTSFLIGIAQEKQLLSINDSTSKYLGTGWTSLTPAQEGEITIKHQLSMTTGLETLGVNWDCTTPECLKYRTAPGNRWFYHNAPYTLLGDVIESASGKTKNIFTNTELCQPTGMSALWLKTGDNVIFYSKTRDLARFGLLILNKGIWDSDTLLHDRNYYNNMIQPSQNLNPSYGYLWWLNGQESYILPGLGISYEGKLIPNAPNDMFAALGKNDQKIYIVPSKGLVIIRVGNAAKSQSAFALSGFDNELWGKLDSLITSPPIIPTSIEEKQNNLIIYPNPCRDYLNIKSNLAIKALQISDMQGKTVAICNNYKSFLPINLPAGCYILHIEYKNSVIENKLFLVE